MATKYMDQEVWANGKSMTRGEALRSGMFYSSKGGDKRDAVQDKAFLDSLPADQQVLQNSAGIDEPQKMQWNPSPFGGPSEAQPQQRRNPATYIGDVVGAAGTAVDIYNKFRGRLVDKPTMPQQAQAATIPSEYKITPQPAPPMGPMQQAPQPLGSIQAPPYAQPMGPQAQAPSFIKEYQDALNKTKDSLFPSTINKSDRSFPDGGGTGTLPGRQGAIATQDGQYLGGQVGSIPRGGTEILPRSAQTIYDDAQDRYAGMSPEGRAVAMSGDIRIQNRMIDDAAKPGADPSLSAGQRYDAARRGLAAPMGEFLAKAPESPSERIKTLAGMRQANKGNVQAEREASIEANRSAERIEQQRIGIQNASDIEEKKHSNALELQRDNQKADIAKTVFEGSQKIASDERNALVKLVESQFETSTAQNDTERKAAQEKNDAAFSVVYQMTFKPYEKDSGVDTKTMMEILGKMTPFEQSTFSTYFAGIDKGKKAEKMAEMATMRTEDILREMARKGSPAAATK